MNEVKITAAMIQKVDDIKNVVNNYLQISVKDTGAGIEFQE